MKNDQYFKLTACFMGNDRIISLTDELGMEGFGAFICLLLEIRQRDDYRCALFSLATIARRLDTTEELLLQVVYNFGLFRIEENGQSFSSPYMDEVMESLEAKRSTNQKNGRKGGRPPKSPKEVENPNENPNENPTAKPNQNPEEKRREKKSITTTTVVEEKEETVDVETAVAEIEDDSSGTPMYLNIAGLLKRFRDPRSRSDSYCHGQRRTQGMGVISRLHLPRMPVALARTPGCIRRGFRWHPGAYPHGIAQRVAA